MTAVTISIPDGVTESKAKLLLAIRLFQEDLVSSGKAAEIAGMDRVDFWKELAKRDIPFVDHDPEDLERDVRNAIEASHR